MAEPMNDGRLNTHLSLIPTVGWTPLVEFRRLAKSLPGRVLAKLECEPLRKRKGYCLLANPRATIRGLVGHGSTSFARTSTLIY